VLTQEGLDDLDRMNFDVFIRLPNAAEMIERMDDNEYKRNVILALALKKVIESRS
jgi:hypothetical protein